MAGSLNCATILGHVGQDPEIKTFTNGGKVANLSVATSESWTDKQTGEKKERTEWHRVSVFNEALAGIVERFVRRGDRIYIEGQIETRKWEKDGVEKYSTEIVLRGFNSRIILLGDKRGGEPQETRAERQGAEYRAQRPDAAVGRPMDDLNDDLDFSVPF